MRRKYYRDTKDEHHRFGCRTFKIDPENGFILNGEEYPLRGVSRHQDRWGKGNALSPEDHKEDIELIYEMGATTIRLAHYQHDQYFYDLCDEYGLVIWAEIPYISKHMPTGRENTISQMKELISQNYNHPSIVVWGLSNEIGIGGSDEDLLENHRILNDLCHEMDSTRLTTVAAVSMCQMDDPYLQIPDVVSYNHYFGWYGGETKLTAKAGEYSDKSLIRKVDTFNEEYRLKEKGAILNWFDIDAPEGYLSLNDKMSDVISTIQGKMIFMGLVGKLMGGKDKGKDGKMEAMGFEVGPEMMSMMGGFTVLRLFTLMGGMMDVKFTKEELLELNSKLNKIKRPKKK